MRNFILSILALVAIAFVAAPEPAHAVEAAAIYQGNYNGVNEAVGRKTPLTVGIIPTATYSAAVSAALSAPTETTIKAATAGLRHTPVQAQFFLIADNATNVLKVELYADTGSAETVLWVGTFDDAAKAGAVIGFDKPKYVPAGAALKWRTWGQGGIQVRANVDYLTTK